MPSPEEAYVQLFGKELHDEVRVRLMRLREALGLRKGDGVWTIFVALEYYLRMYEQVPERIKKQTRQSLDEYKRTTREVARASMAQVLEGLREEFVAQGPKLLIENERRLKWRYIRQACLGVALAAVVVAFVLVSWQGRVLTEAFERAAALSAMGQAGELNEDTWEWLGLRYSPAGELFLHRMREGRPVRAWLEDAEQCAEKGKTLQCVAP